MRCGFGTAGFIQGNRAVAAGMPAGWPSKPFAHPAHHIILQEALKAARGAAEQVKRLEAALDEIVPTWSMAPVVDAFQAMRGVGFVAAVIFVAELGDLRRLTISPKDEKHTGRLRNRDRLPAFGTRAGGGAGVMIGLSR
jgi:transposase